MPREPVLLAYAGIFRDVQALLHDARGLEDALEIGPGNRIQIEVEEVRAVRVVAARVPGIEVDAAEIDHPEQGREIVDHREVDDASRAVLDRARPEPVRTGRRRALHEEELALRAVRIALHDHRPVPDVRQEHGRDVRVVGEQVAFRQAELRPERLREIRERQRLATDADLGVLGRRGDLHSGRADARARARGSPDPASPDGAHGGRRLRPARSRARFRRARPAEEGRPGSCLPAPRTRMERGGARRTPREGRRSTCRWRSSRGARQPRRPAFREGGAGHRGRKAAGRRAPPARWERGRNAGGLRGAPPSRGGGGRRRT